MKNSKMKYSDIQQELSFIAQELYPDQIHEEYKVIPIKQLDNFYKTLLERFNKKFPSNKLGIIDISKYIYSVILNEDNYLVKF